MNRSKTLRFLVLLALAAPLMVLSVSRAHAQVSPLWDHYKVYLTDPAPGPTMTYRLLDQFGPYDHFVIQLERFMNPTQKQVLGGGLSDITNPDLHYSWWAVSPQPFSAVVGAVNQFGDYTLNVHDAVYLLNPALKNQPGATPPTANHYKCYLCDGPPVDVPVVLTDQFGPFQTAVALPRYLCNPVEKLIVETGQVYPIEDPNQHYVCYEFLPPDLSTYTATMTDQFVTDHPMVLGPSELLCVPTFKTEPTGASTGTWGRLKVLYR